MRICPEVLWRALIPKFILMLFLKSCTWFQRTDFCRAQTILLSYGHWRKAICYFRFPACSISDWALHAIYAEREDCRLPWHNRWPCFRPMERRSWINYADEEWIAFCLVYMCLYMCAMYLDRFGVRNKYKIKSDYAIYAIAWFNWWLKGVLSLHLDT